MLNTLLSDIKKRMDGAIGAFKHDLSGLRTGRATPNMLDPIQVEAYGDKMPINQLATVSVPEPRLISVQVWDQSMVPHVEKAISTSGLGFNPSSEGNVVRIPIPDLSEERRKEMVKVASQYAEKAKVAVRNVRRDGNDSIKKLEKDGEISQDEMHDNNDEMQKITDEYIKNIDELLAAKEVDILET